MDVEAWRERLMVLRAEHRELDETVVALTAGDVTDQLGLQRAKRRKLRLRDEIARIESLLIEDIIA